MARENRIRARYDGASAVGGANRRRHQGRSHIGPLCIPHEEAAATLGYRFPADPQTDGQRAALQEILVRYARTKFFRTFGRFTVATLSKALGLSERTVSSLRKDANSVVGDADRELVEEILHGMMCRELAGCLGTPRSDESREVFAIVNSFRPERLSTAEEYRDFDMFLAAFKIDYKQWILEGETCGKTTTSDRKRHRPPVVERQSHRKAV